MLLIFLCLCPVCLSVCLYDRDLGWSKANWTKTNIPQYPVQTGILFIHYACSQCLTQLTLHRPCPPLAAYRTKFSTINRYGWARSLQWRNTHWTRLECQGPQGSRGPKPDPVLSLYINYSNLRDKQFCFNDKV